MSGTEEVPGTRPTQRLKKESEHRYPKFIRILFTFIPLTLWVIFGMTILHFTGALS